ncbi:MAG TPA: LysM domain-containing protein [Verrucomicrobiae bacterium]|jgi:LysM repeat protein|nr:LysM domain-containing protein [Verrucomicrobiae bacterium]
MRWRVLLLLSLLANIALAGGLVVFARRTAAPANTASLEETNSVVKTNVVVRRQFLSWSHVESPDYTTYIANLRNIGCPEQTIRDIIIADVDSLYARREATEIFTPQQEWWRSEPDPQVVKLAATKLGALDSQRRALLSKLLGPDWEGGDLASLPRPTHPGIALDGPVLGVLPTEAKQAVANISSRAEDRMQAYLEQVHNAGKNPDPAEMARLRDQTRTELAAVLSPAQLEEYLLRYSQTANNMRADLGKMKYFNATPEEFRAIFRATDSIDEQIQLLGTATDPITVAQRNSLQQQRDSALRLALGQDRYLQYQKLQDPLYQQAMATAIQAGDPSTADTIYGVNLASQNFQSNIQSNTNLTDAQKAIALKQLELDQLKAATAASGQPPLPEPAPTPAPPTGQPHVMGKTETVEALSQLYKVPLSAFQAANPNVDLNNIKPGDTIRIPSPSPALGPGLVIPPGSQ